MSLPPSAPHPADPARAALGGAAPAPTATAFRPPDLASLDLASLDLGLAGAPSTPAVALRRVTAGYGRSPILTDLSLTVDRGELVGIVGPSGSGKTTLLRLLTAGADRHHGEVEVLGRRVGRRPPTRVGYVPQLDNVDRTFPLDVLQIVLLGDTAASARRPWFSRAERRRAGELLDRLGLDGLHHRRLSDLSGGQQQRAFVARALFRRSQLLLLDEPTSGVDPTTRRDVLTVLAELHRQGMTVVLTTHDLNAVAAHLPRVVCLNGQVTADGAPGEVLTPAVLARTYGGEHRVLRDRGRVVVLDAPPVGLVPAGLDGSDRHGSGDRLLDRGEVAS